MRTQWVSLALATSLIMVGGNVAVAAERFEDAIGDALGDAPDIVAVTVDDEDSPLVSISIEFGEERPFGSDMETWTDAIFVIMAADPAVDERGYLVSGAGYVTGTHAVQLDTHVDSGAILLTPNAMLEDTVDVAVDGPVLTFTLDSGLMDSPPDLYFQILVGVERYEDGEEVTAGEEEGDMFPDEGEPPAHVQLDSVDR